MNTNIVKGVAAAGVAGATGMVSAPIALGFCCIVGVFTLMGCVVGSSSKAKVSASKDRFDIDFQK